MHTESSRSTPTDMSLDIDPEKLISLVKQAPVLWDRNQEDYKSRVCTKDAWRGICGRMIPHFNTMFEVYRENYEKHVMKKWRNIKDNYIKSRKKWRSANRKKYIFHKHLTFLDATLDLQEMKTACSSENDESEIPDPLSALEDTTEDVDADSCTDIKPDISFMITKMEKPDVSEESLLPDTLSSTAVFVEENHSFSNGPRSFSGTTNITNLNSETEIEGNRHMLFFKSLLPSLKDFTDDDTLAFQATVITAIRDIKRQCANNSKSDSSQ